MMKQCNVLALPNFTGRRDNRKNKKTKEEKTRRQKDRKTGRQKDRNRYDGETMQNAHLTQPQVDKMTERIFFMLPTP